MSDTAETARGLPADRLSVATGEQDLVTVRVWELPVRVTHWLIFFSVVVLAGTGFYIGHPFITTGNDTGFLMGKVRLVHLVAAWVFMLSMAARIAWAFLGNKWAGWRQFIPVERRRRRWTIETLKFYLFVRREPPPAVGHNPLAGLTYVVVYLMFTFQVFSGLAMMSMATHSGWQWWISGWLFNVASPQVIRLTHHLVMWFTIGFAVHHVFSAMEVDTVERSGLMSSIVTGYKRLPRERL